MRRPLARSAGIPAALVLSIAFSVSQTGAAAVGLPGNAGAPPGAIVVVPLEISSAEGVLAADIVITFDAAVVTVQSVDKTTLSAPHTLTTNDLTPGVLRISLFGATALTGGGDLLNITFRSAGPAGGVTTLHFQSLFLNEGRIPAAAADGRFCVRGRPDEVQDLEIRQSTAGSSAALLVWGPVPYAQGYNVYRGARPDLADLVCSLSFVGATSTWDDAAEPAPGGLFVYLVTSFNCSDESTPGFSSAGQERTVSNPCL